MGYGALTLANVRQFGVGGMGLQFELVRGGPDRAIDYCHFEVPLGSAAGQERYQVCAEERKLTSPTPTGPYNTGQCGTGHVRACYAAPYEQMEEALARIARFVGRVR